MTVSFHLRLQSWLPKQPAEGNELTNTGVIATLVLIAWPWWFDRHRDPAHPASQRSAL